MKENSFIVLNNRICSYVICAIRIQSNVTIKDFLWFKAKNRHIHESTYWVLVMLNMDSQEGFPRA